MIGDSEYMTVRNPSFATMGDARRMRKRSPQCFEAGAQFALDRLLSQLDRYRLPGFEWIELRATEILRGVQEDRIHEV